MLDYLRELLTPEKRRIIGAEAQQALDNRHWKEAFVSVNQYLDEVALSCDPDNKEKAQRIVLSKQLLASIQRELIRKIEDGEVARTEIEAIEAARRPRSFSRM